MYSPAPPSRQLRMDGALAPTWPGCPGSHGPSKRQIACRLVSKQGGLGCRVKRKPHTCCPASSLPARKPSHALLALPALSPLLPTVPGLPTSEVCLGLVCSHSQGGGCSWSLVPFIIIITADTCASLSNSDSWIAIPWWKYKKLRPKSLGASSTITQKVSEAEFESG